jgi:hypothetical protein
MPTSSNRANLGRLGGSFRLEERLAIGLLQEQKLTYNETPGLSLTRLDGTTAVTIQRSRRRQARGILNAANYCRPAA